MVNACVTRRGVLPSLWKVSTDTRAVPADPNSSETRERNSSGYDKRKDATSPKLATGQEGAVDNEPGLSGQRRSSQQAAARPAIVDVKESAGELEASPVAPSLKRKAVEVVPTVVKRV